MLQTWLREEIGVLESIGLRLSAAEDQASDVIGLPRCAHEFVHLLHQVLQRLLGVPIGKIADGPVPSFVSELFACFIEGFNDAIGKENQRVAGLKLQLRGLVNNIRLNSQRQSANVQS